MIETLARAARATSSPELSARLDDLAAAANDMVAALVLTRRLSVEDAEREAMTHPRIACAADVAGQVLAAHEELR